MPGDIGKGLWLHGEHGQRISTSVTRVWFPYLYGLSLLLILTLLPAFLSGFSGYPPSIKTNTSKFQFHQNLDRELILIGISITKMVILLKCATVTKKNIIAKNVFALLLYNTVNIPPLCH